MTLHFVGGHVSIEDKQRNVFQQALTQMQLIGREFRGYSRIDCLKVGGFEFNLITKNKKAAQRNCITETYKAGVSKSAVTKALLPQKNLG